MKRYILMLLSTLLLSSSLFALEVYTHGDTHQEVATEMLIETSSEAESSVQTVWDDLYTNTRLDFVKISKKISCSESHFNFFNLKKEIFRPPWFV